MGIGPSTPEKARPDGVPAASMSPTSSVSVPAHPMPINVVPLTTASIEVQPHGIKRDEETDFFVSPSVHAHALAGKEAEPEKKLIPVVFRWEHGGKQVFIAGTFDGWTGRIPLNKSEKDFTLIANLPAGPYQYKFIVDGKWRYAPDLPTTTDRDGNVNNTVEVKELPKTQEQKLGSSPPGNYTQELPAEDFSKEPPVLPPHLERTFLNLAPPSEDATVMPLPHHVVINHVYSRQQDDLLILGATHRYNSRFITTVFYKPNVEVAP